LESVGLGEGSTQQVHQAALRKQVQAASISTGAATAVKAAGPYSQLSYATQVLASVHRAALSASAHAFQLGFAPHCQRWSTRLSRPRTRASPGPSLVGLIVKDDDVVVFGDKGAGRLCPKP
jgi:hypothetical protein